MLSRVYIVYLLAPFARVLGQEAVCTGEAALSNFLKRLQKLGFLEIPGFKALPAQREHLLCQVLDSAIPEGGLQRQFWDLHIKRFECTTIAPAFQGITDSREKIKAAQDLLQAGMCSSLKVVTSLVPGDLWLLDLAARQASHQHICMG